MRQIQHYIVVFVVLYETYIEISSNFTRNAVNKKSFNIKYRNALTIRNRIHCSSNFYYLLFQKFDKE